MCEFGGAVGREGGAMAVDVVKMEVARIYIIDVDLE